MVGLRPEFIEVRERAASRARSCSGPRARTFGAYPVVGLSLERSLWCVEVGRLVAVVGRLERMLVDRDVSRVRAGGPPASMDLKVAPTKPLLACKDEAADGTPGSCM
eukprot:144915-Amorphochlora_amoeboformis.AAC.2